MNCSIPAVFFEDRAHVAKRTGMPELSHAGAETSAPRNDDHLQSLARGGAAVRTPPRSMRRAGP